MSRSGKRTSFCDGNSRGIPGSTAGPGNGIYTEKSCGRISEKSFEEKPELAQFQEKFILQVPTDRADTVLRKMRNWYFEAAHQRVSPYQLLTVTEAICKELDLFYRMPEKQEKCPRPLQYRDADLFLDAFENGTRLQGS